MHDEDGSLTHIPFLIINPMRDCPDHRLQRWDGIVIRTLIARNDIAESRIHDRSDTAFADGERRGTKIMCQCRFPIDHDISYRFLELFIRQSHILRILLLRHRRHVAAIICRLPHHRTVAIRMRSDIMPIFCDGSQKIRIVLHIPGDDEKGPLHMMLAKDIEQMID